MGLRSKKGSSSVFTEDERNKFKSSEPFGLASSDPAAPKSPSFGDDMLTKGENAARRSSIDASGVKRLMELPTADQQRYAMDHRLSKVCILLIAFIVIYLVCLILPDHIGSAIANPTSRSFAETVQSNFEQLAQVLSGTAAAGLDYSSIVVMLLIALAGAGLASVGAAYQVSFRNQLATPSSLGVMSGASVGLALFYLSTQNEVAGIANRVAVTQEQADALASGAVANPLVTYLGFIEGALYALVGACVVVALTVTISKLAGHGKLNNAVLIIAGQVFASIANAFMVLFRMYLESTGGQSAVSGFAMAQTGDFSGIGRSLDLVFMGLPIIVALVILFLLSPQMNAIALGEDEARTYGLKVDFVRGLVIALSTVITAIIVAFVGSIGFVGFAIPQLVRRFVGPNFKYLLPASALAGASFLLVVNFIYTSFSLTSTGVGVITSLFGGVVFIFSIVQQRKAPAHA